MTVPYASLVEIVCSDSGHAGRVVYVANFTYADITVEYPDLFGGGEPGARWEHDLEASEVTWRDSWAAGHPDRRRQVEWLNGDIPADRDGYEGSTLPTPRSRERYSLTCDLCGLNLTVRAERLTPVLDRLAEHGVTSVDLTHLAAILA